MPFSLLNVFPGNLNPGMNALINNVHGLEYSFASRARETKIIFKNLLQK